MKRIYLIIFMFIFFAGPVYAQGANTYTLRTTYPVVYGTYSQVLLVPQAFIETEPCVVGSLYFNQNGKLRCCQDDGFGQGYWHQSLIWQKNGNDVFLSDSINKKIGVGTENPEFRLTLEHDGGIMAKGTFESGETLTTSGAGTRLIWYPRKATFRSGGVDADQWDEGKMGSYSFAAGFNTSATGACSIALGEDTISSGYASIAMGYGATVSGNYGIAIGNDNTNSSNGSGLAIGSNVTKSGLYSAALGYKSTAGGATTTALGISTSSLHVSTSAMGNSTTASDESYAMSMGDSTIAKGECSVAMGDSTTASETYAVAMGNQTIASNVAAMAMGDQTTASGKYSFAMGSQTVASGQSSTAMGRNLTASGDESMALGQFVTSQAYRSFVFGRYNVIAGDSLIRVDTDPIFVIANGSGDLDRKNTLTILKNGNVGINTDAPKAKLHIVGVLEYADNATALAEGLQDGDFYRTGDELKIVH